MVNNMDTIEIIKLASPIIVFQLILQIYCAITIIKNGVANLNKIIWLLIVVLGGFLGPILYLMIGRKKWND